MNLILLFEDDFASENKAIISGRRAIHINEVHRASIGKTLNVGLLGGKIGIGTVIDKKDDTIELDTKLSENPPNPLNLKLIVALPRPKSLKKVIHIATTLGIKEIYIIETWKVEKSYWQSPLLKTEKIMNQLILGLEQAKDTVMPKVFLKKRFKPFAEDELPEIIKNTTPFVAHPSCEKNCPYNIKEPITLAIGPEGGFTNYEVTKLKEIGFSQISIGERILRVEFAIPTIIGRIS